MPSVLVMDRARARDERIRRAIGMGMGRRDDWAPSPSAIDSANARKVALETRASRAKSAGAR